MEHKVSAHIQAEPAEIPDSMKADLDRFAGRFVLSAADGCKALCISKTKWFELRKTDPTFPRPIRIGAAVRYRVADLIDWTNSQANISEVA